MAVSAARAAAFEILLRVAREDSYASELLHSGKLSKLSARDHGLATELVMGVLRWRSLLDERLAGASSQKISRLDDEVLTSLRLGAYQLFFLDRVPMRAAIFESVELVKAARKRSAASFVNAVLRKIAARKAGNFFAEIGEAPDPSTLARNASHPEWLVARWHEQYGLETARRICAYDQMVPETTIYVHDDRAIEELTAAGVQLSPGRLLAAARRVVSGDVTAPRAYQDGRIAIQDEASQLIAVLAGCGESADGQKILDCCAAPGSKTALLARRNPHSQVLAMELHPHRARLLQTLHRLPNVRVVAADARHMPFSFEFQRILADVPCSGTGTLARNSEIKWRLKQEDLLDLQKRQIDILRSALARVARGGRLVYSTCSMEREENEVVVEAALDGASQFRIVDFRQDLNQLVRARELAPGIDLETLMSGPHLRTIPGVQPCEGFFAALIERKGAE